MTFRHVYFGWFVFAGSLWPQDIIPATARIPGTAMDVRPDKLPDVLSEVDIPAALRRCQPCDQKPSIDPTRAYLPDRNPGIRQPPCPCKPLGHTWIDAEYLLGWTERDHAVPANDDSLTRPGIRSGLRARVGTWLDSCNRTGVEATFLYLESRSHENAAIESSGPNLYGFEGIYRQNLKCEDRFRWDLLAGYRYLSLNESTRIANMSAETSNRFHGAQVGISGEYRWERLYLDGTLKTALGVDRAEANDVVTTRFGVVPEVDFVVGYQVSDHARMYLGYGFLYWNDVNRPGEALRGDRNGSEFWLQTVRFGVEMRW